MLSAMPSLTAAHAKKLLQFVAEAESLGGIEPFTGELLVELGLLIESDWVTYTEVDHVHRRSLVYLPRPGDEDDESVEITAEDWELMREHPVCQQWSKDGRFYPLRLSDVITQRELRQNRFFDQYLKPWGIEHELKVRLPSPPWHAKTFMFNRKRESRDFTERDRLILDLLQPHLARLWQAAKTRRLLKAALAELDRADEHDSRGVVLLGGADEISFASPAAGRLLREYFSAELGRRLPAALGSWLEADGGQPFVRELNGRRLTVRRDHGALLLDEKQDGILLTAREREVVSWVARGKTNAEIARLLWLAPSTVRKHLENVYAKLGVNTRTAAVASFLGLIDAEAS
jgi:DNA-binding CsgD family transcriptional regulator